MAFKRTKTDDIKEIIKELAKKQTTKCTKCNSLLKKSKNENVLGICSWKGCKKIHYQWSNTIFEKTKLSKTRCLKILEMWVYGTPIKYLCAFFRTSRQTICKLLKKMAKIIEPKYNAECEMIGGADIIVEVDESKFGKRKYNRGHRVEGTERKKIRLIAVDDRTAETLNSKLAKYINPESIIYSDSWKGYKDIIKNFAGHFQVNHSQNYVDPINGAHTNTIEGNWNGIKMNIPYRSRTKERIQLYLIRFMLQRNEGNNLLAALLKYLFYYFLSLF